MSAVLNKILEAGVVAIIRSENTDNLLTVVDALKAGGIDVIEVSMATPGALEGIKEIADKRGQDILVGVGTVTDTQTAKDAIRAGAEYVISPVFDPEVMKVVKEHKKIIIPGALTPTEIFNAWGQGADIVKVFPSEPNGPKYIKSILAPLPGLRLMAVGGIGLKNAGEYIKNGACVLGVGGCLVNNENIKNERWDLITEAAVKLRQEIKAAREEEK